MRGLVYLAGMWIVECATGWLLRKFEGTRPWDCSNLRWSIHAIITLEYGPVWFIFGLAFERIHDAFVKLTPAISQALTG